MFDLLNPNTTCTFILIQINEYIYHSKISHWIIKLD